jgi:hypothetical protein
MAWEGKSWPTVWERDLAKMVPMDCRGGIQVLSVSKQNNVYLFEQVDPSIKEENNFGFQ